jgi:putative chitinase
MSNITKEQLTRIMPNCPNAELWTKPLNDAMERFEIDNSQRQAAFLAQVAHESNELRHLVENLNYAAERLLLVWPKRFSTLEKAKQYERNPEKLANYVYANRLGNGDEASGDGWRYRGRGLIQITGRGNYRTTGQGLALPLEQEPERLEEPDIAALSAAHFWKSRGLNELADDRNDDNDDEDFVRISVAINGGTVGLEKRKQLWDVAKNVLV